jgi:hypothetical protein
MVKVENNEWKERKKEVGTSKIERKKLKTREN